MEDGTDVVLDDKDLPLVLPEMEDYKGKNYLTVKGTLEAYGIYVLVEKKDTDNSTSYEGSEIIGQSKEAGEKVSSGDTVILYIPNIVVKYPDFSTYTVKEVKDFCDKNGVNLVINPDGATEGKIISQSRKEGTTVAEGTTLKITVDVAEEETEECEGDFC